MSTPEEFFALEATETLVRLGRALGRGEAEPQLLLRDARALRGAAMLAGHHHVARAGRAMEGVARMAADWPQPWPAATVEQLGAAVEALATAIRGDVAASAAAVEAVVADLERLGGTMPPLPGTAAPTGLSAGVRAFIAREAALIAGALDGAARAVRFDAADRLALDAVERRMHPLQGLDVLADAPPLPALLEGLGLALGHLRRDDRPDAGAADLLDAATAAMSRVARDVADTTRSGDDSPEFRRFAALLAAATLTHAEPVPIAALFADDDPAPVVAPGPVTAAAPDPALVTMALVAVGGRLRELAARLAAATGPGERALLVAAVARALADAGATTPAPPWLGRFWAHAVRARELARRAADGADAAPLAALLQALGSALARAADPGATAADLALMAAPAQPLAPAPAAEPEPVPITALAPAGEPPIVMSGPGTAAPAALPSILEFTYRGRAALERAAEVRGHLVAAMATPGGEGWRPLLDELLDLVPLALQDAR